MRTKGLIIGALVATISMVIYTLRWHGFTRRPAIFTYYNTCLNDGVLLMPDLYQVSNDEIIAIDNNDGQTLVLLLTPQHLITETTQTDGHIYLKYYQRIGRTWQYRKMLNWVGNCNAYEFRHLEMAYLGIDSAFYMGCGSDWVRWDLTTGEPHTHQNTPLPQIPMDTGQCVGGYKSNVPDNPISISLVEHLHQCIVYWNSVPIDTFTYQPIAVPTHD